MLAHLADVAVRSLLLAALAAVVLWMLRRTRTAALQHAIWTSVVCGMLALFAFGQALPRLPLRLLERLAVARRPLPPDLQARRCRTTFRAGAPRELFLRPRGVPSIGTTSQSTRMATIASGFLARLLTGMWLVRRLLTRRSACGRERLRIGSSHGAGYRRMAAAEDCTAPGMARMGSRKTGCRTGARRRARAAA